MSSQAVAMESDNATYLDTYAWVLYKRGEYSQARYYIKLAIERIRILPVCFMNIMVISCIGVENTRKL